MNHSRFFESKIRIIVLLTQLVSLSSEQLKAVQLFIDGASEQEVSDACGCSRSTVQRWKRKPEFQLAIENGKQQVEVLFKEEIKKSQQQIIEIQVQSWEARREELRELEWQLSERLFRKGEEMLSIPLEEKKWTFREAFLCLQTASELARKSSQTWDDDINSALQLVRSFGYAIIDEQECLSDSTDFGIGEVCTGTEENFS
jgi:transposase